MQTVIHVVCSKGSKDKSLRTAIEKDAKLEDYNLIMDRAKQPGRNPGWAKLRGISKDRRGVVNIEWDADLSVLVCRVINKGAGRPGLLVGDLINYLLERHSKRIKHLLLWSMEPSRRKPTA